MTATNAGTLVYGTSYRGNAPENYEKYFVPVIGRPFATDLVSEAAIRPGERVLDVACGTGVVARLAAEQVGAGGTVCALDVNSAMLAVARDCATESGAAVRWYETNAESMPLPDASFDVVLCQLGLQFMNDKSAALREMGRVLVPGGRLLASTARPNAFFDVLHRAVAQHIGPDAAEFVHMVFSLDAPDSLERLLQDAGFHNVSVRVHERVLRLPRARDFLWQYVHCTPLTALLAETNQQTLEQLENTVVAGWRPWSQDGGISYQQELVVASGRA